MDPKDESKEQKKKPYVCTFAFVFADGKLSKAPGNPTNENQGHGSIDFNLTLQTAPKSTEADAEADVQTKKERKGTPAGNDK